MGRRDAGGLNFPFSIDEIEIDDLPFILFIPSFFRLRLTDHLSGVHIYDDGVLRQGEPLLLFRQLLDGSDLARRQLWVFLPFEQVGSVRKNPLRYNPPLNLRRKRYFRCVL